MTLIDEDEGTEHKEDKPLMKSSLLAKAKQKFMDCLYRRNSNIPIRKVLIVVLISISEGI